MADQEWNAGGASASSFGRKARMITPGSTDLDPVAKTVVMLAAGDITIIPQRNADGVTIAFTGVPAGYVVPYIVRRVTACTSTCATVDG